MAINSEFLAVHEEEVLFGESTGVMINTFPWAISYSIHRANAGRAYKAVKEHLEVKFGSHQQKITALSGILPCFVKNLLGKTLCCQKVYRIFNCYKKYEGTINLINQWSSFDYLPNTFSINGKCVNQERVAPAITHPFPCKEVTILLFHYNDEQ